MLLGFIFGIFAVFVTGDSSNMAVRVYTEKHAYATDTNIHFLAVTEELDPLEFLWDFGGRRPVRATSRAITKKFHIPERYNVTVRAFSGKASMVSDVHTVIVQSAIKPNKLQFQSSVLINTPVDFKCRISAGTNVTYLWSFGDGTTRLGQSTEQHVFDRLGEFVVKVTVHNLVSAASLTGHIFVTREPCLPPAVKNMGPNQIQVQRYQPVSLGVTYEAEMECDASQGLQYRWVVYSSDGREIQLAPIKTHRQNIELPPYFLNYGIYRIIAKVHIIGSAVYSNYTVCVEVVPSPPISIIHGATNLFISRHDNTIITLSGEQSHDPDFPLNPVSYSWHCKPVSRKEGPCFKEKVPASLPELIFPVNDMNPAFDQFKFTLAVQSGGRSSSSEMFVTITRNTMRNLQINCGHCKGNTVNWNEQFFAKAFFEKETFVPDDVVFSWSLYIVNGTNKVISEVPFCRSVDQGAPAKVIESPNFTQGPLEKGTSKGTSFPYDLKGPAPSTPSFEHLQTTILDDYSDYFLPEATDIQEYQYPDVTHSHPPSSSGKRVPPAAVEPQGTPVHLPATSFPLGDPEEGETLLSWHRWGREAEAEETQTPPSDQTDEVNHDSDDASDSQLSGTDSHLYDFPEIFEDGGSGSPAERDTDLFMIPSLDHTDLFLTGTSEHPDAEETSSSYFYLIDYGFPFTGIEEGHSGTSAGRPTAVSLDWSNGGRHQVSEPDQPQESFLMDSKNSDLVEAEETLLDLERELIDPVAFESYTTAGISSSVITLKPYSLRPNSLYMLAVTASEQQTVMGKSQLFFSTQKAPEGTSCLIQPSKGFEILTDFSVFCASGKEDLLYQYSYAVGKGSPVVLYEGRDFQHYFHLPSGGHENDYEVTIYTMIENKYGATTKPCSATVKVFPSFQRKTPTSHIPEQDLLIYSTKNLTRLMQRGNIRDVHNYISLLKGVLSRFRQDPASSQELLRATHNALVSALCQLTLMDERSLMDNIHILQDLMEVTEQVTLHSAKMVTKHLQDISAAFPKQSMPGAIHPLKKHTVSALVSVLSHTLKALHMFSKGGIDLTSDILHTITDLSLKHISNKASECLLNTSILQVKTWRSGWLSTNGTTIGPVTFHYPTGIDSLIHGFRSGSNTCLISQVRYFKLNPYYWGKSPVQLTGDVADIRLYNCTTWRKIRAQHLASPLFIEFQKKPSNVLCGLEFTLQQSEVNIHWFNVTPELFHQAIQVTVELTRPTSRTFPIMLLFRMSERPTPILYNIKKIHNWDENTVHIFLPSSYLHDTGTGYVSILNADYDRTFRNKYTAPSVNYTLKIESIHCLSWDGVREWTHEGCSPKSGSSHHTINCSCSQLSTFTVAHQAVQSHIDFGDVIDYIKPVKNLTLCWAIALCLVGYSVILVVCMRANGHCETSEAFHFLPDCRPLDRQLYSVTIDTGLRSRANMTAKVYIVLYGEDGVSETKELHIPERTLFQRNSKTTFILSATESLGPIWMVHLWHNNGGPSPSWYVSHVLVRELQSRSSWFFLGECWLAADEDDGKVERKLMVCKRGLGFRKLLYMKLCEYLEDVHPWLSVYSCPPHSAFSRIQRLTVCLLLQLGFMCAGALFIDTQHHPRSLEQGLTDVFMVTGLLSAVSVLPVGCLISLLFRLGQSDKRRCSPRTLIKDCSVSDITSAEVYQDSLILREGFCEPQSPQGNQSRGQDVWINTHEHNAGWLGYTAASVNSHKRALETPDSIVISFDRHKVPSENFKDSQHSLHSSPSSERGCFLEQSPLPGWCFYMTWSVCLCLCVTSAVLTGILGVKFSPDQSQLWICSQLFSFLACAFVLHPTLIFTVAVIVTLRYSNRSDFYDGSIQNQPSVKACKYWMQNARSSVLSIHNQCEARSSYFNMVLRARQRARYLRLVRPPSPDLLRHTSKRLRKNTVILKSLSEVSLYVIMLVLLLFVTYGKSCSSKYQLNQAIKIQLKRDFQSLRNYGDWWNWTSNIMLKMLYKDTWSNSTLRKNRQQSTMDGSILIGEPILKKTEAARSSLCQRKYPEWGECAITTDSQKLFGKSRCYDKTWRTVSLGQTWPTVQATLDDLRATDWLNQHTCAVAAQFTLYNPPSSLFSTVTLQAEWCFPGGLWPSARVESTRLFLTMAALDCATVTAELLFLILVMAQLFFQLLVICQKGLLCYCLNLRNWLEGTIIMMSILYYVCLAYHFILKSEKIDHMLREDFRGFFDLETIAFWEQLTVSLHGAILFLLLVKSLFVLQMNKTMGLPLQILRASLSNLIWPMVAGVILIMALSSMGNLLFHHSTRAYSSLLRSINTMLVYSIGPRKRNNVFELKSCSCISGLLFLGSLICVISMAWTAVIKGMLISLVKMTKRTSRKKLLFAVSELRDYIKNVFVGKRINLTEDHNSVNSLCLEEFEDLVDELLFKLNAFSNSLHHTLPSKDPGSESPFSQQSEQSSYLETEVSLQYRGLMISQATSSDLTKEDEVEMSTFIHK